MKGIETGPRERGFVLWGHCQNLLDDRRTYQVPMSSAFWFWSRKFLKGFYHIWAWRQSWSCHQDHLNKLSFSYPKESRYETLSSIGPVVSEEKMFEIVDGRTDDGRLTDA